MGEGLGVGAHHVYRADITADRPPAMPRRPGSPAFRPVDPWAVLGLPSDLFRVRESTGSRDQLCGTSNCGASCRYVRR
jgi:hypothetical protein